MSARCQPHITHGPALGPLVDPSLDIRSVDLRGVAVKRVYEGKTRNEAIDKACTELNITREQLHFEMAADEGEGLYRRVSIRVLSIDKREESDGQE